jgi:ATP-dependent DNA ligase
MQLGLGHSLDEGASALIPELPPAQRRSRAEFMPDESRQAPRRCVVRGESLQAPRRQGMEGIVAKRRSQRYRPGDRVWTKTKN